MHPEQHITDIARTIELSVAPVFLLTALGTILGVLSNRLGRVVDRARVLMALQEGMVAGSLPPDEEIAILGRRRVLVNRAITFATVAALLVCLVIAFAFLGLLLGKNFGDVMAWLFIAAMASFITSLLSFLREIVLTVSTVRLGMRS
jgi:hypothetical protein